MYKCNECGHLFENGEEKAWNESHGEHWLGCPLCSGSFEEAVPCSVCGTYDYDDSEDNYCESCKENVKKRFQDLLNKNFSEEERELLNGLYDGEWL